LFKIPNGGSVNQIVSSDFTTMSFGELSGFAVELVHQHGDGAVIFGPGEVLAGDDFVSCSCTPRPTDFVQLKVPIAIFRVFA
jgi:hypothetical protein